MIRKLWREGNVLAFKAAGTMTVEDNEKAFDEIRKAIRQHGKVNLIVWLPEMAKPEISAVNNRLRFAREHGGDIERYAIVGDQKTVKLLSSAADKVTDMDLQYFPEEEEEKAREWVLETQQSS
ncbi:STAS/SEC14 domain-containing protein [Evansella clarkii]|uniref:STAS/SEC14 domain-containing protein n=1 Tax=Evansella clarkii TaxID=79879 RepID=UPI000B441D12|nr:STAS/SEC14 domain-containing protein [Evansella clarkii]